MKKVVFAVLVCLPLALVVSSCRSMYPNRMFAEKDYQVFEMTDKLVDEYVISANDELVIEVHSRDGFKLVDAMFEPTKGQLPSPAAQGSTSSAGLGPYMYKYRVNYDGYTNLPVLGDFYVKGYTERELKRILEAEYSKLFTDPFVITKVVNRRVYLFSGDVGKVIPLGDEPTTLIEVLARGGGLQPNFKAYNIKLIRGNLKNPTVVTVDLSTIEGLTKAELNMQSGDIIYIDFRRRVVSDALKEASYILSLTTSVISSVILIQTLSSR